MKKILLSSAVATVTVSSCVNHEIPEVKRPNIVFIMTDDHTTQAMSCYGSKLMETPNIDRIANEGVMFNNCFVTNGISAPSRAVILTGKFSHINGVTDNAKVFDGAQQTYPKMLRKAGYQTAMIGKWHLGSEPTGFDYWSVLPGQGDYYNPEFKEMGKSVKENGYVTDIITDKAIKYLEKRDKTKPFLMIYQHKAPHRNWMPAMRHLGMFDSVTFAEPDNLFDNFENRGDAARNQEMMIADHMWDAWDFKLASKEELDDFGEKNQLEEIKDAKQADVAGANKRSQDLKKLYRVYSRMNSKQRDAWNATYAKRIAKFNRLKPKGKDLVSWKYQNYLRDYLSCVASVDENVGRLMNHLKSIGELDNTIIVYTSDQGFFLGEHGYFDKRMMYEECYRMPLLVRYPKSIKKGVVTDALAMNVDFAPTFLDYAGVDVPKDIQGKSLRSILDNNGEKPSDWRKATYYHYYEYPSWHSVKRHYGIRTERYKLIHFYNDVDQWELYDMKTDPKEMRNLYSNPNYKKVVEDMKMELKKVQTEYKDSDPTEQKSEFFKGVPTH